jgi:hypothetical protein
MKIEVLYVPNCPNHSVAVERLREILSTETFQAHVDEILVRDATMAQALRFPGSPTIRVNGHDVVPQDEQTTSFGLMCRLYIDGSGVPSEKSIRVAIAKARHVGT